MHNPNESCPSTLKYRTIRKNRSFGSPSPGKGEGEEDSILGMVVHLANLNEFDNLYQDANAAYNYILHGYVLSFCEMCKGCYMFPPSPFTNWIGEFSLWTIS